MNSRQNGEKGLLQHSQKGKSLRKKKAKLAKSGPKELSLNNFRISGRYPLPAKAKPFVLLRAAGGG